MKLFLAIVFILAVALSAAACTSRVAVSKTYLDLVPPYKCGPAPKDPDEVLVVVHYFDVADAEDGPLFYGICPGGNHTADLRSARRIVVDLAKEAAPDVVRMHFQLDDSVTKAGLQWRNEDPVWLIDQPVLGEVPKKGSWCKEAAKAFTVTATDLYFYLCPDGGKKKRHAVELLLKSANLGPADDDKDIRVDPQIVHRPNALE